MHLIFDLFLVIQAVFVGAVLIMSIVSGRIIQDGFGVRSRAIFGRVAIAALLLLVGFIVGGIYSFGQTEGTLRGLIIFAVIAFVVDRLIVRANRKSRISN